MNDEELQQRDAAKIQSGDDSATQLRLETTGSGAHFLLIEMAKAG